MPELDINSLVSAIAGGGAVWAGIRADVKYLLKMVEKLEKRVEQLELKKAT
jgi:hypothetical protein